MRKRKNSCLVCREPAVCRGLCTADYQAARYAIETGKTTEEQLIEARLMLPRYATNATSEFRSALIDSLSRKKRTTKWINQPHQPESEPTKATA